MKKFVTIIVGLIFIVSVLIVVQSRSQVKTTFEYQRVHDTRSLNQKVKDNNNKQVIVLYRKGCSVCQRWQHKVVPALDKMNNVTYVEFDEKTNDFVNYVDKDSYKHKHLPLGIILEKQQDRFKVSYVKRLNSEDNLDEFVSHIKESKGEQKKF